MPNELPDGLTIKGLPVHLLQTQSAGYEWAVLQGSGFVLKCCPTAEAAINFACRHADLPPGWKIEETKGRFVAAKDHEGMSAHDSPLAAYLAIQAAATLPQTTTGA